MARCLVTPDTCNRALTQVHCQPPSSPRDKTETYTHKRACTKYANTTCNTIRTNKHNTRGSSRKYERKNHTHTQRTNTKNKHKHTIQECKRMKTKPPVHKHPLRNAKNTRHCKTLEGLLLAGGELRAPRDTVVSTEACEDPDTGSDPVANTRLHENSPSGSSPENMTGLQGGGGRVQRSTGKKSTSSEKTRNATEIKTRREETRQEGITCHHQRNRS